MNLSMLKSFICLFVIFSFCEKIIAQTTATDFHVADCDGNSHHLFSELDSGKVVVIVWVMPCGPCATYALNAYAAVQTYSSSHPNRVLFYLVDDYANTTCQSLHNWANTYGMGNAVKFSDPAINMSDYGQNGMPKVVVVGGSNHQIYFNKNSSTSGIENAIDQALSGTTTNIEFECKDAINIYPNPTSSGLKVLGDFSTTNFIYYQIYSVKGELLIENSINPHEKIQLDQLAPGQYVIHVKNELMDENFIFNLTR